ncbi:hypothetical protein [Formosa sp. A9]|uniref:hypothetical protein n=1 Tax=Formosa sp. A9 TaxID=3442641 RepID=UPI003EBEE310
MDKTLKIISITFYSLIILMGQMIGLPFIFWLIFTSFEFGNSDQIFAVLGLIGVILNFTKYKKFRLGKVLSFVLMLAPIARQMTEIPIEKFNYLAFQIPLLIFVITYLIYILKQNENKKTEHNNV